MKSEFIQEIHTIFQKEQKNYIQDLTDGESS